MNEHELAAGLELWRQRGEPYTLIEWLVAALDKREAETVWEVRRGTEEGPLSRAGDFPGDRGWEPFAFDPRPHHDGAHVVWRRRRAP